MRNIDNILERLSPERRQKIEAHAAKLLAEELTLRDSRRARKFTQVRMAKKLGISQDALHPAQDCRSHGWQFVARRLVSGPRARGVAGHWGRRRTAGSFEGPQDGPRSIVKPTA